jgi:proteic killer suppression protein
MDVTYESDEAKKLCTQLKEAQRKFGTEGSRKLLRRHKELTSAEDWQDVIQGPGRWHPLQGDWAGHYAADVTGTVRIVVHFSSATSAIIITVANVYH